MNDMGNYFERRAREERDRAKTSATPRVAHIHLELAKLYDQQSSASDAPGRRENGGQGERRL